MAKSENNMKKFWKWLKQHTLLYNIVVIGLIFIGIALLSFIAMALGTRHSVKRTVPDFVGLRLNDAEYFAGRRDLQIIVNDSLHVASYPGGVVLDQLPKGGVVVKPGRKIYVTINASQQPMVTVPYVAGRSLRQAKNMLEAVGLTIERLEYTEDIATNYVLEEEVNGIAILEDSVAVRVEMGSGVLLRVGLSPNDSHTSVPQLIGRTLHEAKSRLWESGLNIGEILFDEGLELSERNRAKVYYQSAMGDYPLEYGSRVSLRLTLDAERIADAVAEVERQLLERERAKMEADSIARAEKRILDSLAALEKAKPQTEKSAEDNFFF